MGPSSPTSHGSIPPLLELNSRYWLRMVSKMQLEPAIRSFEPKVRSAYSLPTLTLLGRADPSVCRAPSQAAQQDGLDEPVQHLVRRAHSTSADFAQVQDRRTVRHARGHAPWLALALLPGAPDPCGIR